MAELSSASGSPILELHGISKTFHGVKVLDQVGLRILPGEVMALLGENGAGKSTLMKIVSGITEADAGGTIRLGGTEVRFTNPRQSVAAGISMIHQDLNLLPGLSVAENLFLGREPLNRFGLIDWAILDAQARKLLAVVHQKIDPTTPVHRLGVGQQQMVEIARALSLNASLIIMDEPTDSLTDVETDILFDAIRQLRAQGKGVIYISHRLSEIFRICDSVTVLRNGHTVAAEPVAGLDEATLIHHMVGREIGEQYPHKPAANGPVGLRVDHLSAPGIEDISFEVHKGEVVGFAGLMGAGTPQLGRTLYGALAARSGSIEVDGQRLSLRTPAEGVRAGIAYVPEDRKSEGLIQIHSVLRNMTLTGLARFAALLGFIVHRRERDTVDHYIKTFSIRTPGADAVVATLSGGNQQKVALAKALITKPRILILDEPTRGVDVGVRREIYSLISDLKAEGLVILFISSDLRELLGIADRILVLSRGRLSGVFNQGEATQDAIMQRAVA
ncbi:MAG TPA: sugar ABC transporter ATP-binding protein [Acetobacteraceae bacterium]|nr:sugar ABC transporter ATP-binding protein [Acetobacteraceae bacterium]